jgi:NADPH:quinone reductase-like Zn-dependent oxidoreductase
MPHMEEPARFRQAGTPHPKIAARLPLTEAAEAHALLGWADVRGRVILLCEGVGA